MIQWAPVGIPLGFDHYQAWFGSDREAVAEARAPAQLWGPADDLNLGSLFRAAPKTISRTTLRGLSAEVEYHVALQALSAESVVAQVEPVSFTTTARPSRGSMDIYRDGFLPGSWSRGEDAVATIESSANNPFAGTESILFTVIADGGFVFQHGDLGLDLTGLPADWFDTALLELAISCTGGEVDYAEVMLHDDSGGDIYFSWPDYYTCGQGFRTVQIPLAAMRVSAEEYATADALSGRISQLWMWAAWPVGEVYVDEVRVLF